MAQLPLFSEDLPPKISAVLGHLCVDLSPEKIPELQKSIRAQVAYIEQALAHNEFLDIKTARRVATALNRLLNNYLQYNAKHRAMIVGAARYFSMEMDEKPDTQSILGLDDDFQVLNYILDQIGQPEYKVTH